MTKTNLNQRARHIAMAGAATDEMQDYLADHKSHLSIDDLQQELSALNAKHAEFEKLDYVWARSIMFDLEGVRILLEDAIADKEQDVGQSPNIHDVDFLIKQRKENLEGVV